MEKNFKQDHVSNIKIVFQQMKSQFETLFLKVDSYFQGNTFKDNTNESLGNLAKQFLSLRDESKKLINTSRNHTGDIVSSTQSNLSKLLGHDVRAPLNRITGIVEAISANSLEDNKKIFETLFYSEGERFKKLISDTLIGLESPIVENYPFGKNIKELLASYNDSRISLSEGSDAVILNENFIYQISKEANGITLLKALKNFIENAIQHAKTSIKISLKQDKETGEIVFEIVDDGNGMSLATINALNSGETGEHVSTMGTNGVGFGESRFFITSIQGILTLESSIKGTKIVAKIPQPKPIHGRIDL